MTMICATISHGLKRMLQEITDESEKCRSEDEQIKDKDDAIKRPIYVNTIETSNFESNVYLG